MYVSQVKISFTKLEQLLNLPPTAKIVAAVDNHTGISLRVVSATKISAEKSYSPGDDISKIGDLFRDEKKKKKSSRGFSEPTPMKPDQG